MGSLTPQMEYGGAALSFLYTILGCICALILRGRWFLESKRLTQVVFPGAVYGALAEQGPGSRTTTPRTSLVGATSSMVSTNFSTSSSTVTEVSLPTFLTRLKSDYVTWFFTSLVVTCLLRAAYFACSVFLSGAAFGSEEQFVLTCTATLFYVASLTALLCVWNKTLEKAMSILSSHNVKSARCVWIATAILCLCVLHYVAYMVAWLSKITGDFDSNYYFLPFYGAVYLVFAALYVTVGFEVSLGLIALPLMTDRTHMLARRVLVASRIVTVTLLVRMIAITLQIVLANRSSFFTVSSPDAQITSLVLFFTCEYVPLWVLLGSVHRRKSEE